MKFHLLILSGLLLFSSQALAQKTYRFQLNGGQEVPGAETEAVGYGIMTVYENGQARALVSHNVENAVAAHIHRAPAGENGPVAFPFDSAASPIQGSFTLTAEELDDLEAGYFYVNVHSDAFPGGEIRGQVVGAVNAVAYEVTVVNLTRSQIFSPPVVVSHNSDLALFTPGQPASTALAVMAEDGNGAPLLADVADNTSVLDANIAGGPVLPGASATVLISASRANRYISVAGMLVSTNDAFFAASGLEAPRRDFFKSGGARETTHFAQVWDAGSETNSEDCAYIPGPPCGAAGARDTDDAEGYVYIHNGIHGIGDLTSDVWDWRGPAALITVKPIK